MDGKRIKYLRNKLHLTQEEFAARVGTSAKQVSRWENENSDPVGSNLVVLADTLDTSTDYLLGRTENSAPPPPTKSETWLVRQVSGLIRKRNLPGAINEIAQEMARDQKNTPAPIEE